MNRTNIAAVAVCVAAGMIGLAQAQTHNPSYGSQTSNPAYNAGSQNQTPAVQPELTQSQIEQAQQQLKTLGLYRGKIDGRLGHETKTAISQFQRRNRLTQTATLDEQTLSRLTGNNAATSGTGSSMPPAGAMPQTNSASPGSNAGSPAAQMPAKRY